jgi:WD40 repeat protein
LPGASGVDFTDVEPIFQQYCVECHGSKDPESDLVLETFEGLTKGGESGVVVTPGKSSDSLLVKAIEGRWGKTGKNQFMPPGKRDHLKSEEIALIKAWIDSGAPAPKVALHPVLVEIPKIVPKVAPRPSIHAFAYDPKSRLLAVGRRGVVDLVDPGSRQTQRSLSGIRGSVNALAFSKDGQFLFAAAGEPGQFGEVRQWRFPSGELVRTIAGHKDAIYAMALSVDAQTLATGSYDYAIKLWNLADGSERRTISANQGAIFDLAFRPDGKILASVSADRTAKIYDVSSGNRLETFGQALKELNAVAWSPDGRWLTTGGNDNRIRVYEIAPDGKEGVNRLAYTKFAHEGAILRLAFSPDGKSLISSSDDRTAKIFATMGEWDEKLAVERQPDWAPAATFIDGDQVFALGRIDGTIAYYQTSDGKPAPLAKPELTGIEPRGIQRGIETRIKLLGHNLANLSAVHFSPETLRANIESSTNGETWVIVWPSPETPRSAYELWVTGPGGDSQKAKLWVDDVPQINLPSSPVELSNLPVALWGELGIPGANGDFGFEVQSGQVLIFDIAARSIGTKGAYTLTLLSSDSRPIAHSEGWAGSDEPLLIHRFEAGGKYRIRVGEILQGGSPEHRYRLTVGELPFVTGIFPMNVTRGSHVEAHLIGANLPNEGKVMVTAPTEGDPTVTPSVVNLRSRREIKFLPIDYATPIEQEPNDMPAQAQMLAIPVAVNGRMNRPGDADVFAFDARKGVNYIMETMASQRGSPMDTRIEVLWPDGKPVERMQLRAVRDSAINFRGTDSNGSGFRLDNWREMELNDWLYVEGEVMKLFRMPQGPDSDTVFYTANGKRRPYFDTTAVAHALDTPAYIVEPRPPGDRFPANGLPVFHVDYQNDDDSLRQLGTDSRLHFTAPADGKYCVRVTDSRAFGGAEYVYSLTIREARPDFHMTLTGANPAVAPGSGQGFSAAAERLDGFEGPITVEIGGLPSGWVASTPLVIESGHNTAEGTLHATPDAIAPEDSAWNRVSAVASASIEGRFAAMRVNNLGLPKLSPEKPKITVTLESPTAAAGKDDAITISPGQTVTAKLSIVRNGFNGVVSFEVKNLPHGVIVDNLGLNGITMLESESQRELFLTASKWVSDMDRPIYAIETATGRQTSLPVVLKIRRPVAQASAK